MSAESCFVKGYTWPHLSMLVLTPPPPQKKIPLVTFTRGERVYIPIKHYAPRSPSYHAKFGGADCSGFQEMWSRKEKKSFSTLAIRIQRLHYAQCLV